MKLTSKHVGAVLFAFLFALVLLPSASLGQDTAADEIRNLEQQWVEAVENRDLDAIVDLFAEDGRIMPPNAEPAIGRDSIRASWDAILSLPELNFSFAPTEVQVAESGDMGYVIGTYQLMYAGEAEEPVQDSGKYVDIWEKVDGEWKVMVEMYNSNLPPQ